jgi:hypothetical protein
MGTTTRKDDAGGDCWPSVMLSPKATKRVTGICGGRVTLTVKEQLALWFIPDPVAVQPTIVVPAPNADPDAGVHVVKMGAVPPEVVGAVQVTVAGWF